MGVVAVDRARSSPPAPAHVTGAVVLDLTEEARSPVDEEFVVEWQIGEPAVGPARDERAATSAV